MHNFHIRLSFHFAFCILHSTFFICCAISGENSEAI